MRRQFLAWIERSTQEGISDVPCAPSLRRGERGQAAVPAALRGFLNAVCDSEQCHTGRVQLRML